MKVRMERKQSLLQVLHCIDIIGINCKKYRNEVLGQIFCNFSEVTGHKINIQIPFVIQNPGNEPTVMTSTLKY